MPRHWWIIFAAWMMVFCLVSCQPANHLALPTVANLAIVSGDTVEGQSAVPPTFTPLPPMPAVSPTFVPAREARPATHTPLPIPTNTPITPTPTVTITPSPTPVLTVTATLKPLAAYGLNEPLPIEYYPRPANDNGWGVHWIPTVSQDRGIVDRFVGELVRMHIKWVVFLQESTDIGSNDYLVEQLVANGIMPVMRIYRSGILPYEGDLGALVRHYRARGVYYYQLYNEPNVNDENHQGVANPNNYALVWSAAARIVIENGGYPGLGALSPGGSYNHYQFLDRTLRALKRNGDLILLNRAWLSVHNYHGLRQTNDPDGFFLFRKYDQIVNTHLQRSLPMIGTEGGSYHSDPVVERDMLIWQYLYMGDAEPYFLVFSHWLLANREGGSADSAWEWQALFRAGFVHPLVTDFFYVNER